MSENVIITQPSERAEPLAETILDAALAFARVGIPVFPCRETVTKEQKAKAPYTAHGFRDATTDEAQIAAWWARWPGALIGMPTGAASGVDVLDVDAHKGGLESLAKLAEKHGFDPAELTYQTTPNGGRHYFFEHDPARPLLCTAASADGETRFGPGVDTRGGGGYVCVAPSVRLDGKRYATPTAGGSAMLPTRLWFLLPGMPKWLFEGARGSVRYEGAAGIEHRRAIGYPEMLAPGFGAEGSSDVLSGDLAAQPERVRRIVTALQRIDCAALDYGDWFKVICAFKAAAGACEASYAFLETWCMAYPKNTPDAVRAKWESVGDTNLGWIFLRERASAAGWTDPNPPPARDDFAGVPLEPNAEADAECARLTGRNGLKLIRITDHDEHTLDQAEAALADKGGVYMRGAFMVEKREVAIPVAGKKMVMGASLGVIEAPRLSELMGSAARFEKQSVTGKWRSAAVPMELAYKLMARPKPLLPMLVGLTTGPTIRADGSLVTEPGYDALSLVLYVSDGTVFPPIADQPTREDAMAARDELVALVKDFPFVDPAGQAVWLSMLLSAVARRSLTAAPLHMLTAPTPGSGKTMLVNLVSIIVEGREAEALVASENGVELKKQLESLLLTGGSTISLIDNLNGPLRSDFLCSALTSPVMSIRKLGTTGLHAVPVTTLFTATGNNIAADGDLDRRAVLCRLDPRCERPELRKFDFNPMDQAKALRGRYLVDALTILRAYEVAGRPSPVKPLGSFEDWSDRIRSALLWIGEADPCGTMDALRAENPETGALGAVLAAWHETIGDEPVTVKRLIESASEFSGQVGGTNALAEALSAACSKGGRLTSDSVGNYLRDRQGRPIGGLRLARAGKGAGGLVRWIVEKV
jgi:putative DNA primase/helicase